jgi:predicted acyltransferase
MVAVGLVLVGYWAAMTMIPVPGFGAGHLTPEGNLAGWVDRSLLPGRLLLGSHDELGLITTLPAVCLTVLGTVAGDLLRAEVPPARKLRQLIVYGLVAVVLGTGWGMVFPLSKQLWTSSFILLTAGISFLFLALFYGVIDVLGWRRWAFSLEVVGMNSLAIYLAYRFFNFEYTARRLFGGLYEPLPAAWHPAAESLFALLVVWSLLYVLWRRRVFITV